MALPPSTSFRAGADLVSQQVPVPGVVGYILGLWAIVVVPVIVWSILGLGRPSAP